MPKESRAETVFIRRVRALGGQSYRIVPVHAGLPDRLVLLPGGVTCLVELKSETGALRPAQVLFHTRAAAIGHKVYVVRGTVEARTWSPD